ncbi:MAG TPA: response regulator transcription factor [Terriglobales bacterium]|nr:response regulator transcription factor [Terriglobales bacterium]
MASVYQGPHADRADADSSPRILLADDHALVREGFRSLLERNGLQVVAEAADGFEAVRLCRQLAPDVALLDVSMPLLDGLAAAEEIHRIAPNTRSVILTMHLDHRYAQQALKAGALGYVLKTTAGHDLIEAIRRVNRGEIYISPTTSKLLTESLCTEWTSPELSDRERQVLLMIAEGKSSRQAATVLGISVKTASAHRARLMSKLGIYNTAGLVRYAIRRGLVMA